jgi:hypothetical protein
VVQHFAAVDQVEAGIREGQGLSPFLDDRDRQFRGGRELLDGSCAHDIAGIGFERRYLPAIAGESV